MYEKPLPVPDAETAVYWEALRGRKLLLKRCLSCARHHFYPRVICPHCHSIEVEWSEASGFGEIHTYTVARRPAGPAFKDMTPYVVAIVQLDEGARMMTNIVCNDPGEVRIGQRVAVEFDDVTETVTLPKFRIVPAPATGGAG